MYMITSIRLDDKTRDRLKTFGKMGQSFDDVLNELMDKVEKEE